METRTIHLNDDNLESSLITAATLLQHGELVAFPTETVYGLGADALNATAVEKVFTAKSRPADNPLIVHIASPSEVDQYATNVPDYARVLMERFWPGPVSFVLPKTELVPGRTTAGLPTVVLRVPSHPIARKLIETFGHPIAAPSANRSGRISPTTAAHVESDLAGRIPLILDAGPIEYGLESTVVDCTSATPAVLRPGSISLEDLRTVIPETRVLKTETSVVRAPGMKYRHYSPEASLILYRGTPSATANCIASHADRPDVAIVSHTPVATGAAKHVRLSPDPAEAAPRLFATLRAVDTPATREIHVQGYPATGVGAAIMNRLEKAAGQIVDA